MRTVLQQPVGPVILMPACLPACLPARLSQVGGLLAVEQAFALLVLSSVRVVSAVGTRALSLWHGIGCGAAAPAIKPLCAGAGSGTKAR